MVIYVIERRLRSNNYTGKRIGNLNKARFPDWLDSTNCIGEVLNGFPVFCDNS